MQNATPLDRSLSKHPNWQLLGGAIAVAVAASAISLNLQRPQLSASPNPQGQPAIRAIAALGRLEPHGEAIALSVSEASGSNRVAQLLVKPGDRVRLGQLIAVMDCRDRRQTALETAQQQVKVARSHLAQVQAGAKTGEIEAQKATIARLEAELRNEVAAREAAVARLQSELSNAQTEYQRYASLESGGAVSASLRDSKKLTLETAGERLREARANRSQSAEALRQQLNEARATLERIAEVRPVDVRAAQAEVDSAIAAVKQAQADLDLAYVRSPREGRVLKIHTWAGEVTGNKGIVEIGETDRMYVVAEIYETDIDKVRMGQRATVTRLNFPGKLEGTVAEIGLLIDKKDVLNTDPAADIDARVVEVKIRLDPTDSKRVAGLTNSKVKVAIAL